ncbi:glutathione S-transferase family protein [Sphingomonas sp.]|uniref:glutathione S-transferase family protein n=1 Tax=Sphingomonas sp. TaxID=28214 RepID=UPI002CBCC478|nr:glutathione S-transferase family protein [Sphingomonas sp.]HWK34941.1 glutathione S-transferase family protein [Sphingomonas sp.]
MLFYDTPDPAPNPRRVRIFAAEKGVALPTQTISIAKGEHRGDAYLAVNPLGQTPALVLDDGEVLTESLSICRYLEALYTDPPLFGATALESARIDMWVRRIELRLMVPVGAIWAHTHPFMARVMPHQFTDFGESNRPLVDRALALCDAALGETPYLAGEQFSVADITLLTTIDFATFVGLTVPEDLVRLNDWHRRVSARPSAKAV